MIEFGGYENCVHKDICKLPICQRETCEHMLKPLSLNRMLADVRDLLDSANSMLSQLDLVELNKLRTDTIKAVVIFEKKTIEFERQIKREIEHVG